MNGVKRLTPPQSRKVNALVRRTCCNYDNGNCILLDDGDECVCPQLISYSLLCKWFRVAETYHPQTSRRAHEEKTRPCYAVGAENPLIYRAFRA